MIQPAVPPHAQAVHNGAAAGATHSAPCSATATSAAIRSPARRRTPAGVSLIEVMLALLLFAAGTLVLAGSSAVTARHLANARVAAAAALLMESRLNRVAATHCGTLTSGAETHASSISEEWRVHYADDSRAQVNTTFTHIRLPAESTSSEVLCR